MSEDRNKFIDFITGLSFTDGETALLLHQKPKRDGEGNFIYHAPVGPAYPPPASRPARNKNGSEILRGLSNGQFGSSSMRSIR